MALFDARNAAHNLMVELCECERAPMDKVQHVEFKMIEHDKEAQVLCDEYPQLWQTTNPQVKEFLEIMGVLPKVKKEDIIIAS